MADTDLDWHPDASGPSTRFLAGEAREMSPNEGANSGFQRIYKLFLGARAALSLALIVSQGLNWFLGLTKFDPWINGLCFGYALMTWGLWFKPDWVKGPKGQRGMGQWRWLLTIGLDVLCFLLLNLLTFETQSNYTAMLVMPVLMAGVLTPRLYAMATAAIVVLGRLTHAWVLALTGLGHNLALTQTGLLGAGFFVIAILAGELAGRLAREVHSAKGSLERARQQAQINRLVIEELQDGVLVVDRRGRVRAANPASRQLLSHEGLCAEAPFPLRGVAAWAPLMSKVDSAFKTGEMAQDGSEVVLRFGPERRRILKLRMRFTSHEDKRIGEDLCVLFLEDARVMEARTRQAKLAAMGRVSAGIAHEIRNPLAAISQANALMSEDELSDAQRRLSDMVGDNVERIKRIVDDVLELSSGGEAGHEQCEAGQSLRAIVNDWAQTALPSAETGPVLSLDMPPGSWQLHMAADHLRRIVVNLLDNALRHCLGQDASVRMQVSPLQTAASAAGGSARQELLIQVFSDGTAISGEVEPHLFEPFFSTRSRGTGLGLYICRELARRYGAQVDYRGHPNADRYTKEFFLTVPMISKETP